MKLKRALISVSDKTGIVDFARALYHNEVEILATGGTADVLTKNDIKVRYIADFVQFPEILNGRVKTLHPKIHGAILFRRDDERHLKEIEEHGIDPIDIIVVNLYPFEKTVSKADVTIDEAIEQIDIGGPTLIRAAAKNYHHVAVVVDPADYGLITYEIEQNNIKLSIKTRQLLAKKAFQHTTMYDAAIANYLSQQIEDNIFPNTFFMNFKHVQNLRYGENPHQQAALYKQQQCLPNDLVCGEQHSGKELSFNNYLDMDGAYGLIREFSMAACAIIKHSNPCGVGLSKSLIQAYQKALATDSKSAFGSIIAFNRAVDTDLAQALVKNFIEVIIAPAFTTEAFQIFQRSKNLRLIKIPDWDCPRDQQEFDFKRIGGGLLIQDKDVLMMPIDKAEVVTERKPIPKELRALDFARRIVKWVKSNAIVFAGEDRTIGIGAGQMSRVDAVEFAIYKAKQADLSTEGSVLASDAFFPFRDGIDVAANAGVTAIVQPGGSIRDKKVIAAANEHGIAMVFTGKRHFRH